MIIEPKNVQSGDVLQADVCVIGSGAAGITIAIELGRNGADTLLLTGGNLRYKARYQQLYKGTNNAGIPLERSRHRRFGGTTAVWGGRCIPFDPIDFEARRYIEFSGWPISISELDDYYRRSQEYLDLGTNVSYDVKTALPDAPRNLIEGFDDPLLLTNRVEKFSLPTNLGKKYYREISSSKTIRAVLDAHLVTIRYPQTGKEVAELNCVTGAGTRFICTARRYVLAMGGFEVTRHLLQPSIAYPNGAGNKSGLLGRFFMTHFSGVIADIAVAPDRRVINRYETDPHGVYCRRRLQLSERAQRELEILNFSSFLHHAPLEDPAHRNPLLSLIFLLKGIRGIALRIPAEYSVRLAYGRFGFREYFAHLSNIVLGMHRLVATAPELLLKRVLRRRKLPSLIVDAKNNRFSLHYHVEHAPNLDSRLTLSDQTDEHGVRRLNVSLAYKEIDVSSIFKAHELIKARLEHAGAGTLTFLRRDPIEHIREQIGFGGHHLGTTRMAVRQEDGVVDTNCKVFGVTNLYVAGPSVFPTAGQANPVLTIVALAIRLADHLRCLADEP
jgi:choline dehydrogenase-like flavoprotein